ncbi:MAG TPA: hypothetical protein VG165_15325 [Solirubrobacteraceae bacterium]|jgi:hypothetical protein|nr:hypothetical protein [Solirubrobacteraceae bacterium]
MNADSLMKLVPSYEYTHPRLFAGVRVGVGVWLLILTAILYGSHRSGWWELLLVPAAALHFFLASWLPGAIKARTNSTARGD